jgi:hypothetical protein
MCARGHKPRDQSQARSAEHSYLSEDFLRGLLAAEHALRITKKSEGKPALVGLALGPGVHLGRTYLRSSAISTRSVLTRSCARSSLFGAAGTV